MIDKILDEMIKRGFVDEDGDLYDHSETEEDFEEVFGIIAEEMGCDYLIDSDCVFDSPGMDVKCKAVAVVYEEGFENRLLTFYHQ